MSQKLRLIDLFAGAGGMTEGFSKTNGFEIVAAVEKDVSAAATYSLNHGAEHIFAGGIEEWRATSVVPKADVVIGGPPCQGFSALGKQDVLDKRNLLWREYALTIEAAQPRYFVLENVGQFLNSRQFSSLKRWTHSGGRLSDYALQPFILNAADFGSYQSRKRAVVIGRRRDLPRVAMPAGEFSTSWRTVRQAFTSIEAKVSETELPSRMIRFSGNSLPGAYSSAELHVGRTYHSRSLERFASIPEGGNRFDLPEYLKSPCWVKHTSGSGDVMGRLRWDRPSVTIRTEFFKPEKGRYLHPVENRAITHYEAAVLQGFRDDYQWVGSKTSIARQIGNAVPVQLSAALGAIIAKLASSSEVAK